MSKLEVYCDGSCVDSVGGYGVHAVQNGTVHEFGGYAYGTTNNQMELVAAIKALDYARKAARGAKVVIISDSKYVVSGITEWSKSWVKRGWRNAKGEPVANRELWMELISLDNKIKPVWRWVKGHAETSGNIRADALARLHQSKAERLEETTEA
jgi:ribonuclease HI